MTHFVGVVSAPRREQFVFRHIDFVPLDARQIMAILIFADNEVQNRVIEPRRVYEPGELERVSNYLNAHFIGRTLADIRTTVLCELRKAKDEMEQLLAHSLDLASQMLVPNDSEDIVVTGQTRLMALQDLSDMDRLRELFEIFASKRRSCNYWSVRLMHLGCVSSLVRRPEWFRWRIFRWSLRHMQRTVRFWECWE